MMILKVIPFVESGTTDRGKYIKLCVQCDMSLLVRGLGMRVFDDFVVNLEMNRRHFNRLDMISVLI